MALREFLQDEQGSWSAARLGSLVALAAGVLVGGFATLTHAPVPDGFFAFLGVVVGGGALWAGSARSAQYLRGEPPAAPAPTSAASGNPDLYRDDER